MTAPGTKGPDRIYLQPDCCVDPREGRQWCEDNVWPDCGSHDEPGVEYVRADLIRARGETPAPLQENGEVK